MCIFFIYFFFSLGRHSVGSKALIFYFLFKTSFVGTLRLDENHLFEIRAYHFYIISFSGFRNLSGERF